MLDRVTFHPDVMGGQPTIRGMRFPVKTVVRMIANGTTSEQILQEHPDLEEEDVHQALEFAAANLEGDMYMPLAKSA